MLAEVSGVELRVPRDNRARSRDVAGIIQNHVLGNLVHYLLNKLEIFQAPILFSYSQITG